MSGPSAVAGARPRGAAAARRLVAATALAAALGLAGCASTTGAQARADDGGSPRASSIDPLEPMNRAVYAFNEFADETVIKPVARGYEAVVPELFRWMIGNAFENLGSVMTPVHDLLQGKPREAAEQLARVVINTTLGFGGLADVASEMGIERRREDFGQTLGRWGVGTGPYLVLPFFGPSSVRDALGFGADVMTDPLSWTTDSATVSNTLWALRYVDLRATLLPAGRLLESASLDKYVFVRDGYLQRRRNQLWDGNPPPLPEEEETE